MCRTVLEKSLNSCFSGQLNAFTESCEQVRSYPKIDSGMEIIIREPRGKVPYL